MSDNSIIISDDKYGLPYSKGLMSSIIMATGLPPRESYGVAKKIENILIQSNLFSITLDELRYMAHWLLKIEAGEMYATRYLEWLALSKLRRPIIVLVGGMTGVGKSTIASEVAHRLGITRLISTDSIREVMRSFFSKELMPALYESSFLAYRNLRFPLPSVIDPLIIGFREQAEAVAIGVKAMIDRAINEASHLVVEGVHVVPGFVDININPEKAVVVPVIITADDKEQHKSHFYIREVETQGYRSLNKYRKHFEDIRRIGAYIEELNDKYGYAKISGLDIDTGVLKLLDEVMRKVSDSPGVKQRATEIKQMSLEWQRRCSEKNLVGGVTSI